MTPGLRARTVNLLSLRALGGDGMDRLAHGGELVGVLGARFALLRRESLGDLGLADGDCAHPSRSGDFLRLQGAIIKRAAGWCP